MGNGFWAVENGESVLRVKCFGCEAILPPSDVAAFGTCLVCRSCEAEIANAVKADEQRREEMAKRRAQANAKAAATRAVNRALKAERRRLESANTLLPWTKERQVTG